MTVRKNQQKKKPQLKMHWAINLNKSIEDSDERTVENVDKMMKEIVDEISKKTPYGISTLGHLERKEAAFGPFERSTHARTMPPSDLNNEHKDFFGNQWAFLSLPMAFKEYQEPVWTVKKVFVCSTYPECKGHQHYKGSCHVCKGKGTKFVKTVEIRDWDKKFQ